MPLFSRFRVNGNSMEPNFKDGDYVVAFSYIFNKPNVKDVIVFKKDKLLLIKRIQKLENSNIIVAGDNSKNRFVVKKKDILGKVIFRI